LEDRAHEAETPDEWEFGVPKEAHCDYYRLHKSEIWQKLGGELTDCPNKGSGFE
jgi:hypothetical protein